MSDWLSVIIVLLIIGIILDGLRRARNAKRDELKISNKVKKADRELDGDDPMMRSSVFPSGGARLRNSDSSSIEESTKAVPPRQTSLDLEDPVPMLMESVEDNEALGDDHDEAHEPSIGELTDLEQFTPDRQTLKDQNKDAQKQDEGSNHFGTGLFARSKDKSSDEPKEDVSKPAEEILIINIMAPRGEVFDGKSLFDALMTQNLKFGQMNIFHRHAENDGDAPVIFSLANIIEPGNFNFAEMESTETPGICFFLSLPTACEGLVAYDDMVGTAKAIAAQIGGDLKDENRSALTNQTIEHGRQRVVEFERKNRLKK